MARKGFLVGLVFLIQGVCSDALESISEEVGERVTLYTGETKQQNYIILWYFKDYRIALIDGDASKRCLYDGEGGRFRDRLEVDYETGSLTITNITAEHTGRYEAEIIRREGSGTTQSLNRNPKCDSTKVIRKTNKMGDSIKTYNVSVIGLDKANESTEDLQDSESGLSAGAVAGISVAVVLIVAVVGFVISRHLKIMYVRAAIKKQDEGVV